MAIQVVFLGTKSIGASCLSYMLEQQTQLDMEVIAVRTATRPELDGSVTVASVAADHGIPMLSQLDAIPPCDIIYSVQHSEILQPAHIRQARIRAVNLHLAPLPEYRGCNQFSFAIMHGATAFGVSIHEIDERIDHGALLFEDRFDIDTNIWVADLHRQATERGIALFQQTLRHIALPHLPHIDTAGRPSGFYTRAAIHALKRLDLNMPAETIERVIRATSMPGFEPPYFFVEGRKIYCHQDA